MIRIVYLLVIVFIVMFVVLQVRQVPTGDDLPVFLRTDEISNSHATSIDLKLHAVFEPTEGQIEKLKTDYCNIWAHLNYLYATNDIKLGKEYYTEDFFKHLCKLETKMKMPIITRKDLHHELHLINWASDALVCTLIDSNVVLYYNFPDQSIKSEKVNYAFSLLLQGDNWRIDGMKVLKPADKNIQP